MSNPRSSLAFVVLALTTLAFAIGLGLTSGSAAPANCGLPSPAFCDNFDQGPSPVRGRGGDLDPSRWSVGRLAPSDISTPGLANPVDVAPIPACRASFPSTNVFPPNDTLICDASGPRTPQLQTAVAIQNYGNNSYMIRQPFDFANRTGKIVFDVDAVSMGSLAAYVAIDITEDPVPAPTFLEAENFETGPVPRNALMMKLLDTCGSNGNNIKMGLTLVYNNYQKTNITPTFNGSGPCPTTRQRFLNHFEIRLSQTQVEVWASDYSSDEGQTYPNFRRIYAANLNLPFSRGYVHLAARNHATKKYGYGPDWIYRWDNVGFDGPVISGGRAYEIPDNTTSGPNGMRNLGYLLLDGTTGRPAGIYDPANRLSGLQFQNVDISGASTARLTLSTYFNAPSHAASTAWGLNFRFNGGPWRTRSLTTAEVQVIETPGSAGNLMMVVDIPISDLRSGSNTLEILPVNAPMDYPPVVANIDLLVLGGGGGGPIPAAPTNLRISP